MAMSETIAAWSVAELDRLPDDGNKKEIVHGDLFVTPPPVPAHESLVARLNEILALYVAATGVGLVYGSKSVVRTADSHVEPDLMVRPRERLPNDWTKAPVPLLVVEVLSGSTRRRDEGVKRDWYAEIGVPEYWIVDGTSRRVRVVRGAESSFSRTT
jgi:Uma2 family endonuclease